MELLLSPKTSARDNVSHTVKVQAALKPALRDTSDSKPICPVRRVAHIQCSGFETLVFLSSKLRHYTFGPACLLVGKKKEKSENCQLPAVCRACVGIFLF